MERERNRERGGESLLKEQKGNCIDVSVCCERVSDWLKFVCVCVDEKNCNSSFGGVVGIHCKLIMQIKLKS